MNTYSLRTGTTLWYTLFVVIPVVHLLSISLAVIALSYFLRTNVKGIFIFILAPQLLRDTIHLLVKKVCSAVNRHHE